METTKMSWNNPAVDVQRFVPQYCQTPCGDGEGTVTYHFKCDAGLDQRHYVYLETNGEPGLQYSGHFDWGDFTYHNPDERITRSFHPCSQTHDVTVPLPPSGNPDDINIDQWFPRGYMLENGRVYEVRVWTANGTNVHCTRQLDAETFIPHNPS